MDNAAEVLSSPDLWKFALPLTGAVIAWFTNEWRKRVADQYQSREVNYNELLCSLKGFYESAMDGADLKNEFLNQLNFRGCIVQTVLFERDMRS